MDEISKEILDEIARRHIEECLRAAKEGRCEPRPWPAPRMIHYSELVPLREGQPLAREWNTFCREIGRLLAEGHEGKFMLIGGETVHGVFDTKSDADRAGRERFGRTASYFVYQILSQLPMLHLRTNQLLRTDHQNPHG